MLVGKALAIMVGKEVLEYLAIATVTQLIGQKAKRRPNTMTNQISFQSILARLNTASSEASHTVQKKVVDLTQSTGAAIKGVMPVTHNALDARTLEIMKVESITRIELADLKEQLRAIGFQIHDPEIAVNVVDSSAAVYLDIMKKVLPKVEATTQPTMAPEPQQLTVEDVIASAPQPAPQQASAPFTPTNPLHIKTGMPTDWHQQ